jgi:hypothetical protein
VRSRWFRSPLSRRCRWLAAGYDYYDIQYERKDIFTRQVSTSGSRDPAPDTPVGSGAHPPGCRRDGGIGPLTPLEAEAGSRQHPSPIVPKATPFFPPRCAQPPSILSSALFTAFAALTPVTADAQDGPNPRSANTERLEASEELTYELAEGTELHQLLDVTPRTGDPEDFLYTGPLHLLTEVTDEVGLEVSVEDEFESRPFVDPETGEPKSEHAVSFFTELSFRL